MTGEFHTADEELRARYPELAGRVAVVTGASGGMGQVFVRGLADQGVHVVAGDLDSPGLSQLGADESDGRGRVTAIATDVTRHEDNQRLVSAAIDAHGRLDIFVGAAGIYPRGDVVDLPADQLRTTLAVNVEGLFDGARAAAAAMTSGGTIVTFSSAMATRAGRHRAAYSISKAAVAHMTRSMALELAEDGIRVNSVAPGFIDTPMTQWVLDDDASYAAALGRVPLARVGAPVEVLGAVLFLVSDSARYVTGHSLAVDGGSSLT